MSTDVSNDRPPAPYPGVAFDATTRNADSWPRHRAKARRVKRGSHYGEGGFGQRTP